MTTPPAPSTDGVAPLPPPGFPSVPAGAAGPDLERVARLAARVLDAPTALVTLIDERGECVAAGTGLRDGLKVGAALRLTHALPRHDGEPGPLSVRDTRRGAGPRRAALAHSGVVAYLAQPLCDAAGMLRGALAVADVLPRAWVEDE
ncbi:MAG TPA: GAF domain-containing protein, partial [Longimicrobium sp.]|nr:GAF domain-containing protein [Longimicrobium sp.]